MIKTLIFDLGNVLLYFSPQISIAQLSELSGNSCEDIENFLFKSGLEWKSQLGVVSKTEIFGQFQSFCRKSFDIDEFCYAASNIFNPNYSMIELLPRIKEKGLKTILLSNTNEMHFEFIKNNYSFINYFDEIVLSYKVRACKPDKKIFYEAVNRTCEKPNEFLFVDDITDYVNAAREIGIQAVVYTTAKNYIEELNRQGINLFD
ncbi:MAG: HAD family phosphatase [Oligoflexales bacterium]|nr:HAD family phosphatase [Oligoflexales bacterium]